MKNYKNVIASTKWLKRVILSYTKLDNLLSKLSYALWVGTKWSLFDHLATCCLSGHDPRMGRRISTCLLGCAIIMFCITACDSGSSSADPDPIAEVSSSSVDDENLSSSSVTDKGTSSGGSSSSSSSVSDKNSSSSVVKSSSSFSIVDWHIPCEGGSGIWDIDDEKYVCEEGFLVPYIPPSSSSSSSAKTYPYKDKFKVDSVFNEEKTYGTFIDSRDGQEYRTIVIKKV